MDDTTIVGLVDDGDGLLPTLSKPEIMLGGLVTPLPVLWCLTLPFGVILALLGHPWIGLISTAANLVGDWGAQSLYRLFQQPAHQVDSESCARSIGLVACLRAAIAMTGAVLPVLYSPGTPEIMFCGLMSCLLLSVAVAQGSMTPRLLVMSAAPVLTGIGVVLVLLFPMTTALPLAGAAAMLAVVLLMMSGGVTRILGEWTEMRARNNNLIGRLVNERIEADRAREEARLAGEAKANFLATMSHEIRTPMNGVLGMAQLLRASAADGEQRQKIETLIHSGEYLMSILNDILDISRIDAGQLAVSAQAENLRAMLGDLRRLWLPSAEEKGLYLKVEIAEDLPTWFLMDARRVRQVLFNLIGNALKFTHAGGVTLSVNHAALADGRTRLLVTVRDTGIGIDPESLPALFERFSQADQSISRQFGGAGLGLAISRQLTELMEGHLWAESRPGEGSRFHLELPLTSLAGEESGDDAGDQTPDGERSRDLSILIVDDNAVNLMILDQVLGALGHQAVRASSGAEALALAAVQTFDLILLDIRMPGMSGIEALAALRAGDGPNQMTPALAVTADVLTRAHGGYLSLGFAGHVSKPIQVASLAAEIDLVMSMAPAASAIA